MGSRRQQNLKKYKLLQLTDARILTNLKIDVLFFSSADTDMHTRLTTQTGVFTGNFGSGCKTRDGRF